MSSGIYNKYTGYCNRRSIRLRECDYSRLGYYFVTICVHDWKQRLFGDIHVGAGFKPALMNEMENDCNDGADLKRAGLKPAPTAADIGMGGGDGFGTRPDEWYSIF